MMDDLFNVDLDLNLDLGMDASNNLDFLPEDLLNFIGEEFKEITENDAIPNIESLINFDEDDQLADDDIQWDFDLDTTDFLFENVQQQQQQIKPDQTSSKLDNFTKSNSSFTKSNSSFTKSISKPKQQKNKQLQQQNFDQSLSSPTSTINSSPNSPISYVTESSSNDSTDFLDMFQTYYSLDSNNNLVSHPISTLSIDELNNLSNTINQANQSSYSSFHQPTEHTFDLSNNFGGFVNMQSALSLVNKASFRHPQSNFIQSTNNLTSIKKTKKKSKGTSLLASRPKSYKTIKKEMLQKKNSINNRSLQMTNKLKVNQTQLEPQLETTIEIITTTPSQQQLSHFRSTYVQDHDYCFGIPEFINSSWSYDTST